MAIADTLEDGHERVIDPREAGAEIYADHGLDFDDIDDDAVKVVRRLTRRGFQAYLVGGCVRDLLAGRHPKDFDIATSATPRQIKKLFRNSRIIGRRFRLVHVHFGSHIIEVSTFRAIAPKTEGDDPLIRRDNVFGRADEDARRRDFTINGLFFDIERREVIDFVGGMRDIRRARIEVIGDPVTRLREDPVRMLRAAKFAGRLRFDLAQDLVDAIREVRGDLSKSAAPRLFEELQRLLGRGGAYGAFRTLHNTGVLEVFLPELAEYVSRPSELGTPGQPLWNMLRTLDQMEEQGKEISSVTRLACLFCHLFEEILHHTGPPPEGEAPVRYDVGVMTEQMLNPVAARLQMPRRDLYKLKQMIIALRRFLSRKSNRKKPSPNQFVRKEYFRDALVLFQMYSRALGRYQGELVRWERRYENVTGRSLD